MGWMPCPDPSFPKGVFALFIDGDSIDKIAPDGATIIVDPSDKLLVDRALYLMMNGTGGATVKLFFSDPARLEPCSNNPEHQTIYPGEEPFFVIGRVIWEGRKLRYRGFMTKTQRAILIVSRSDEHTTELQSRL